MFLVCQHCVVSLYTMLGFEFECALQSHIMPFLRLLLLLSRLSEALAYDDCMLTLLFLAYCLHLVNGWHWQCGC